MLPKRISPVVLVLCMFLPLACTGSQAPPRTARHVETDPAPPRHAEATSKPNAARNPKETIHRVALSGEAEVVVAGTILKVRISESSAKIGAPVSRVNVLARDGAHLAEAGWVIESGVYDKQWRPITGRFWNPDAKEYQEGSLPGWEIRLVSLDDFHSNGSPTAVTVELRRTGSQRTDPEETPLDRTPPERTSEPEGNLIPAGNMDIEGNPPEGTPDSEGWYRSGTTKIRAPKPFSPEQGELARRDLETFRSRGNEVAACYRQFLPKNPRLAGILAIALNLTQDGRVTDCRLEKQPSERGVGACVCTRARAWHFPVGLEPGPRLVRHKWSLVPE